MQRPSRADIHRRTIVITGASSGIGRAAAVLFGRNGWNVGLVARGMEGLRAIEAELAAFGAPSAVAVADVADAAAVERAAAFLEERLGPIDVWVNCAGNGVFGRFLDVSDEEFRRVTDVTYTGTVNGTRAALKRMRARDAGAVVNVCSGVAFHGMPLLSSYSGAKYAVRGELRQENSRVTLTTVFPPAVNTPFFAHALSHLSRPPRPAKPVYQPELVARALLLVAARPRREFQISGTTVAFALANRLSARMMDRVIALLGYDGQTTGSHRAASERDPTLFVPSPRASGARGAFDDEARRFSLQLWAAEHRGAIGTATAAALGLALLARAWTKRQEAAKRVFATSRSVAAQTACRSSGSSARRFGATIRRSLK